MADNTTLDAGSGGDTIATASLSFSGDTAKFQIVAPTILTGSEGAWTQTLVVGGAGAVTGGTPRVTLASDDPAVTALQIIDDWDESDRAKVNPIAGQAGVAAGSGTVSALTQRVVLATDVALPTGSNVIGAVTQSGSWSVTVSGTVTVGSHAVTNAGTFVVQVDGSALTSLQLIDDVIFTDDAAFTPASSKVAMIGAQFDDTLPDSVDEGDAGALRMSGRRELYAQLRDAAGNERGANVNASNELLVALSSVPSHAVTNAGTFAVQAAQSGTWTVTGTGGTFPVTDSSGSLTVDAPVGTPVFVRLSDGAAAITTLAVSLASVPSHAVTNAGTFAVQVDGSALTSLQLIDDVIFTDDAAFTPASSKVLVIGAQADEDTTDSVNEGDAGALRMTLERKLRVVAAIDSAAMQSGNDEVTPKFAIIDAATSGNNTLVSAVASKKIRVVALLLVAAGTVTARFEGGADGTALTGQMNLVANSGFTLPYSPVGWFETAANTLLNLELSGAISVDGCLVYIEVD